MPVCLPAYLLWLPARPPERRMLSVPWGGKTWLPPAALYYTFTGAQAPWGGSPSLALVPATSQCALLFFCKRCFCY